MDGNVRKFWPFCKKVSFISRPTAFDFVFLSCIFRKMKILSQLLCFICLQALVSCADGAMDDSEEKGYQKKKESIRQTEIRNPEKFLVVEFHKRKNLLGQLVVEGKVTSKAAAVSYKDIELVVSFFGRTNALLKEEREVIYDSIPPGLSRSFKRKYFNAGISDSMTVQVVAAGHL